MSNNTSSIIITKDQTLRTLKLKKEFIFNKFFSIIFLIVFGLCIREFIYKVDFVSFVILIYILHALICEFILIPTFVKSVYNSLDIPEAEKILTKEALSLLIDSSKNKDLDLL